MSKTKALFMKTYGQMKHFLVIHTTIIILENHAPWSTKTTQVVRNFSNPRSLSMSQLLLCGHYYRNTFFFLSCESQPMQCNRNLYWERNCQIKSNAKWLLFQVRENFHCHHRGGPISNPVSETQTDFLKNSLNLY